MHSKKIKILYLGVFDKHCSDQYRVIGIELSGKFELVGSLDFRKLKKIYGDNFKKIVEIKIREKNVDCILMNKAESITPDDILYWKKDGVKIAYWYGDMRDDIADYVSNKLKYIDLFLTNSDDKKYIEKISSLGIEKNKIFFSHTATDLSVFRKYDDVKEIYDVSFFGSNYYNKFEDGNIRTNFIKKLNSEKKYKIKVYGNGWNGLVNSSKPVYGKDFSVEASKTKIILGFSSFLNKHLYTSNRIWNSMACGFYLVNKFNGINDLFENKKHLVWFENYDEMKNLICYYLEHSQERRRIFEYGREQLKHHTYMQRANDMYKIFMENELC